MNSSGRRIIIVQGQPATGKTTLARRLARDIDATLVEKDAVKEFFSDYIGVGDLQWSHALGKAAIQTVYLLLEVAVAHKEVTIVESAFWAEIARQEIRSIAKKSNAQVLELYCTLDETERQRRFQARIASGERHKGHADEARTSADTKRYEPLDLGSRITVDTTHFDDTDYIKLKADVLSWIKGENNETTN